MARIATIRLMIAIASVYKLVIHQMDVKTAFLNGDLEEEIYIKQPEGCLIPGQEHKVCKLVRSLYGLKQAPKQWHEKFDSILVSNGFHVNDSERCLYSKFHDNKGVFIILYVDDMLIMGTSLDIVKSTKTFLMSKFDTKDMGEADVILGIKIIRRQNDIILSQAHYVESILRKYGHFDDKPVKIPLSVTTHLQRYEVNQYLKNYIHRLLVQFLI